MLGICSFRHLFIHASNITQYEHGGGNGSFFQIFSLEKTRESTVSLSISSMVELKVSFKILFFSN